MPINTDLETRLLSTLFGAPLVNNAFRGTLVEAMLAQVLEPGWRWCSAGWASHDFENAEGVKLEVKKSTALQSWHEPGLRPNSGRFDIKPRKGRYEGTRWIDEPGRAAQIYVLAWHGETDPKLADHRDAAQWQFYAVKADNLPKQKTIALSRVAGLANSCSIDEIAKQIRSLGY